MAKYDWKKVEKQDVLKAIKLFLKDNPEYPSPRSTFLLYENKKLPAKHIRGMAYKIAFGEEISKEEYAGGMETVRFFLKLGFDVFYHGQVMLSSGEKKTMIQKEIVEVFSNPKKENKVEKENACSKIKISSKEVIEQKNALQLLLNKYFDGDIVCEKTYPWLKTPNKILGEYESIYDALHELHGDTEFARKNVVLRCDFVSETKKTIIEYDERQHFSAARKVSLEAYPDCMNIYFDKKLWIKACQDIQAKDNYPVNRDEVRAFYDSTRDIEAAKHGYRLIRIMHGQVDWTQPDAMDKLEQVLSVSKSKEEKYTATEREENIRIGLYLQTKTAYNDASFYKAMESAKNSKFDILVFPEDCYCPRMEEFWNMDVFDEKDYNIIADYVLELSSDIEKAVVFSSSDKYGTLYSIFANAFAEDDETQIAFYVKHTMTQASAFEISDYQDFACEMFEPILFKHKKIGLTICYDCNHSAFSRVWGEKGVDIIINSTGGDVVYDKWYKYNKARAIENHCYNFVTMGGSGDKDNPHTYVYGFNREGKELAFSNVMVDTEVQNQVNTIYVFDTKNDDGEASVETSIDQLPTSNKNVHFEIPVGSVEEVLKQAKCIKDNLYVLKHEENNIVFCVADGMDIMKPEKVLSLLYSDELKKIPNKRYVIINRHKKLDKEFYRTKLSIILKVRAMENFCAVILESDIENQCYQCGNNRTVQLVKPYDGKFGIDLQRTGGPEVIWKNKTGMRAAWREKFEWIIAQL